MSSKKYDFIPEPEAAKMIGYKPSTLRRYVRSGKLDIVFTHINQRRFQYDRLGIQKLLVQNSNA